MIGLVNYPFKKIIIIYNPKSTGDGEKNAVKLKQQLGNRLKGVETELIETEYSGHSEKLGREYAQENKHVLLVSSSGDGGYNELVNGVLSVDSSDNVALCVLPSGNANDHYNAVSEDSVLDRIVAGRASKIDVLKVTAKRNGKPWSRYAHSYVGIGMTAYIGQKLTEARLNPLKEKWLVVKYLVLFRGETVKIHPEKKFCHYSSIVVSNIDRMSKIIKLDQTAEPNDGLAELYTSRTKSPFGHIFTLLLGSTIGMKPVKKVESIKLTSKHNVKIQCDGEVFTLDSQQQLRVSVASQKIATIL